MPLLYLCLLHIVKCIAKLAECQRSILHVIAVIFNFTVTIAVTDHVKSVCTLPERKYHVAIAVAVMLSKFDLCSTLREKY